MVTYINNSLHNTHACRVLWTSFTSSLHSCFTPRELMHLSDIINIPYIVRNASHILFMISLTHTTDTVTSPNQQKTTSAPQSSTSPSPPHPQIPSPPPLARHRSSKKVLLHQLTRKISSHASATKILLALPRTSLVLLHLPWRTPVFSYRRREWLGLVVYVTLFLRFLFLDLLG